MGYECIYKTTVPKIDGLHFMKCRHLYEIQSPKKHNQKKPIFYMVWLEEYENNFFAIKFHQRKDKKNSNRYSIMTGNNEARPIIISCIKLLVDYSYKNPKSSFGFIGAGMIGEESMANTKRFSVYRRLVSTFISEELFEHHFIPEKSTYVLLRKSELVRNPDMLNEINSKFKEIYPLFE